MDINHDKNTVVIDHDLYQRLFSIARSGEAANNWDKIKVVLRRLTRHVSHFNPHVPNPTAIANEGELHLKRTNARYLREIVKAAGTDSLFYVKGWYGSRDIYVPVKVVGRAKRSGRESEQMIAVEPAGISPKLLSALAAGHDCRGERGILIGSTSLTIAFVWSRRQWFRADTHRRPIFKVLPRNIVYRPPVDAELAPEAHHGTFDFILTGCYMNKPSPAPINQPLLSPSHQSEPTNSHDS